MTSRFHQQCKFNKDERFLPFQLGKKQKLAPIHRTSLSSLEGRLSELDDVMPNQDSSNDYLNSLKSLTYKKGKSEPTWRRYFQTFLVYDVLNIPFVSVKITMWY